MRTHPIVAAGLGLVLALLAGCAGTGDPADKMTAAELYEKAKDALDSGAYETAIENYEKLEARYPYGPYAEQAQLEIAYAYYKFDEPESAIAAADRFIKLHPRHPHVDYAYYLKGLVNINRGRGLMGKLFNLDQAQRDIGPTRQAFRYFSELVRKFPDSRYAEDARKRMMKLRGVLAEHELVVAEFYMRRKAYVAAANRATRVIEDFPHTSSVRDALAVLTRAYRGMGLADLAADAYRVLALNYPEHPLVAAASPGTTGSDEEPRTP